MTRTQHHPALRPRRRLVPGISLRHQLALCALLAPYLIGSVVLIILPLLLTAPLALTSYDGLSPPRWVGLGNLRALPGNPLFTTALRNSLLFTALLVPLRVTAALALALLLRRARRGVALYRTAIYVPTIIPGVAYALIWLWVLNPIYGPLNALLAAIGLPAPAWLTDPATALPALVLAGLFQLGESFVVLLAGLDAIPAEYDQAAEIDGAGRWQRLTAITLPLLAPWLLLTTMRELIASAQSNFTPAMLMTGGGPYYATLFLPQLIYEVSFDRLRFGQGAAMTLVGLLGLAATLALLYGLVGGWGYDDEV
ncbi:sugar ABC transporter permease [Oscillochloris sp. ZM17-4]|uniref:carbohydrate ABC transporter permease n=1 Tax=Oscillochloris sp. ZM17-4 TaxID=2866714 RepID=UPI001C73CC91|nr:sugar ABC transporter permease [Oscillochloris sp. ZM17-4]MBX0329066.1 sugar ABC transporter permease [Oscillochloris sp. ZM17-4]